MWRTGGAAGPGIWGFEGDEPGLEVDDDAGGAEVVALDAGRGGAAEGAEAEDFEAAGGDAEVDGPEPEGGRKERGGGGEDELHDGGGVAEGAGEAPDGGVDHDGKQEAGPGIAAPLVDGMNRRDAENAHGRRAMRGSKGVSRICSSLGTCRAQATTWMRVVLSRRPGRRSYLEVARYQRIKLEISSPKPATAMTVTRGAGEAGNSEVSQEDVAKADGKEHEKDGEDGEGDEDDAAGEDGGAVAGLDKADGVRRGVGRRVLGRAGGEGRGHGCGLAGG